MTGTSHNVTGNIINDMKKMSSGKRTRTTKLIGGKIRGSKIGRKDVEEILDVSASPKVYPILRKRIPIVQTNTRTEKRGIDRSY